MKTIVTSRHFKAHDSLVEYAQQAVAKLGRYYDGIIKCEVILSYEKPRRSVKIAEIIASVYRSRLAAVAQSGDFHVSIDEAVQKVLVQLKKYKAKLRAKDRVRVRQVRAKV
jgi:ribosomal subunit interface protein